LSATAVIAALQTQFICLHLIPGQSNLLERQIIMNPIDLFSAPGRFWRGNLHTHSTLSDGALEPERVINAYRGAGYDFMCLSDHFWKNL
jgi:hypothetical protein